MVPFKTCFAFSYSRECLFLISLICCTFACVYPALPFYVSASIYSSLKCFHALSLVIIITLPAFQGGKLLPLLHDPSLIIAVFLCDHKVWHVWLGSFDFIELLSSKHTHKPVDVNNKVTSGKLSLVLFRKTAGV